jgi:predicted ArsR family transcriptional regulator
MPLTTGRDFTADNRAILNALQTGRDFTANQLRTKLGITNVSARVNDLRNAGYPIYLNTKTTTNGRTIRVYRIGTPSRKDLALARLVKKDTYLLTQFEDAVSAALRLV